MNKRLGLLVVAVVLATGCPSLSTLQTPSTVPKGKLRGAVGAEAVGIKSGGASITLPQLELGLRYGVTDNLDLGAKLYGFGGELGLKYQFLRGEIDGAVAPAVSYMSISASASGNGNTATSSLSILYLHLPILFGYNVSENVTLGFGPKALLVRSSAEAKGNDAKASATNSGFLGGAYVGIPLKLGDAFWIAPELNIYKAFSGVGGVLWQGGIGFYFGGAPNGGALK